MMLNRFYKTFAMVAVVATLSTGCKYTKEYQKITEVGNKYTTAVDELLVKASELQIDASSEKLLLDDKVSNQNQTQYEKLKQQDRETLQVISDLRNHNKLLQRYFDKLQQLAHSDAPEQTQAEIEGITSNIQTISSRLQASTFFPNKSVLGGIGKLIIHSKIEGVLRKELEKRDRTILQELTVQQEMLKNLSEFMKHRIALIQQARELRLLIRPLIAEDAIADGLIPQWVEERKQMFFIDRHVAELENASYALAEFKDVYKDSVEGNINSQRLNNALKDINSFLALLNTK